MGHPVLSFRPIEKTGLGFSCTALRLPQMTVYFLFIVRAFNVFIAVGMGRDFQEIYQKMLLKYSLAQL